jgi:hypothetical protein
MYAYWFCQTMYVSVFVRMHVFIFVCTLVIGSLKVRIVYNRVYMYVCMHVCMYVCRYVCM